MHMKVTFEARRERPTICVQAQHEEEKPQLEGFWSGWLFWQRVIPTKIQDRVLLKCSDLHENGNLRKKSFRGKIAWRMVGGTVSSRRKLIRGSH